MSTLKRRAVPGLLALAAGLLVLSQCVTFLERRPGPPPQRRAPAYAVGKVFAVTGTVRAAGPSFLLNDDASDFTFQFAGVRMDQRIALQKVVGRHVTIQLSIRGQQGPRVFAAELIRIVR